MVSFGEIIKHRFAWVRCFAHMLNLIVQDSLSRFEIDPLLKKLRLLRLKFKYEKMFKDAFLVAQNDKSRSEGGKELRRPVMLLLDVATRWNSTLFMIRRALLLKEPIEVALLRLKQSDLNLTIDEWRTAEILMELLEPFHVATEEISSQTQVTISKPLIILQNRHQALQPDAAGSEVAERFKAILLQSLEERQLKYKSESQVPLLGSMLDPRFKQQERQSPGAQEAC